MYSYDISSLLYAATEIPQRGLLIVSNASKLYLFLTALGILSAVHLYSFVAPASKLLEWLTIFNYLPSTI